MWTLDNLPLADLKARYGFTPTPEWIRHVQLSCIHFGGASGAFVSPDGLVLTNHHVALSHLHKLSSPQKDYVRDGFIARTQSEEIKCVDAELRVLISTQDVTKQVVEAVDEKTSPEEQNRQRKAQIARIEKDSMDQTGLQSDVVALYRGGEYWLYRYKKYTDVRLVMAPEYQAAFFGGDPDNFTYPRFCLDFAFFRVYENDKPAKIEHYLKFNPAGAKEGELVFVAGHPGSTQRLRTLAQLQFDRDYRLPVALKSMGERRKALYDYAARGPEQARQVKQQIFGIENGIKALTGRRESLRDHALFSRLAGAEEELRRQVQARPELAKSTAGAWDRIAEAMQKAAQRHNEVVYRPLGGSRLAEIASTIVRYVGELEKPNEKRYEEFRASSLDSTNRRLYSAAPIYPELEEHLLARSLTSARSVLGAQDPLISAALAGKEPAAVAKELIAGTHLTDPAVRKALVQGGRQAVEKSDDPLIVWARKLDPLWRELRDWQENNIQSVELAEGLKIAQARFAIYGRNVYPDATHTLRLSFGRVAGYDWDTTKVPYKTTFLGMLDRAASFDNQPPFDLPPSVAKRRDQIDATTPLNFVSTNDIIGGNSGSPVLNRQGQYVGLIFDGNLQGMGGDFAYTDEAGRAISVHSRAIIEALEKIYQVPELAKELKGK